MLKITKLAAAVAAAFLLRLTREEEASILADAEVSDHNVHATYAPDPQVLIHQAYKSLVYTELGENSGDSKREFTIIWPEKV